MSFYYQDMDVYYIALGLVDSILEILKRHGPRLTARLRRLEKITIDIPLTIARISGDYGKNIPPEGFLEVRAKVFECQSLVEILWRTNQLSAKESEDIGDTLMVLSNMLTDLATQVHDTSRMRRVYRPDSPL